MARSFSKAEQVRNGAGAHHQAAVEVVGQAGAQGARHRRERHDGHE
ncbi:hypothetical protein ACFSTC_33220 [Nonomuraea ferruginea]